MEVVAETRFPAAWARLFAWLPLAALPLAIGWAGSLWPQWGLMWALAVSIYAGAKWLSFADSPAAAGSTLDRSLGYLLLWPGMDAEAFCGRRAVPLRSGIREAIFAGAKLTFGGVLIGAASLLVESHAELAAWVGLAGIAFLLHFGLFHVLSIVWRLAGIEARAIMNAPILATSLGDFWGRRWNLAFRDLAHAKVFRPLADRLGIVAATLAVFFVSGIVHDVVISIPARGGLGLPTLYFTIQGLGVLFERSRLGRRLGIRRGRMGRLYCAAVTLGPVGLLFHAPFLERVIVPMLGTLTAL